MQEGISCLTYVSWTQWGWYFEKTELLRSCSFLKGLREVEKIAKEKDADLPGPEPTETPRSEQLKVLQGIRDFMIFQRFTRKVLDKLNAAARMRRTHTNYMVESENVGPKTKARPWLEAPEAQASVTRRSSASLGPVPTSAFHVVSSPRTRLSVASTRPNWRNISWRKRCIIIRFNSQRNYCVDLEEIH